MNSINEQMLKYLEQRIANIKISENFSYTQFDEFNEKVKNGNTYGLDCNFIPIRQKEQKKKNAFGWIEINKLKYNINTPKYLLPIESLDMSSKLEIIDSTVHNRTELFDIIIEAIYKLHPTMSSPKCIFNKMVLIVRPIIDTIDYVNKEDEYEEDGSEEQTDNSSYYSEDSEEDEENESKNILYDESSDEEECESSVE